MTIKELVKEIERGLNTLELFGITNSADRQWLEHIERQVDTLRDYRQLKERVEDYDNRIQIIYDRDEVYQESVASLGDN